MINKVCYTYCHIPELDDAVRFSDFRTFISCFKLAIEQSKKYFDIVEVCTNESGKNKLLKHLNGVKWLIVDYDKYDFDKRFWNFPKLITYSLQNEPFIHSDIDVIFLDKPNDLDIDILTEKTRGTAILQQDVYPLLPDNINKHLRILCSGIIGGNNYKIFHELYSIAKEAVKKERNLNKITFNNLVAIEEITLTHLIKKDNISFDTLGKNNFIHFQGRWKENLKKEHLTNIDALQEIINNNKF